MPARYAATVSAGTEGGMTHGGEADACPDERRHTGSVVAPLRVNRSVVVPERELRWRFSRSSGPGGQSVNTADSRVAPSSI